MNKEDRKEYRAHLIFLKRECSEEERKISLFLKEKEDRY